MTQTPRASSSWQGNRPLADVGSGSPGEVTGTERSWLQGLMATLARLISLRLTPTVDNDAAAAIYGTNVANSIVKWSISQAGLFTGTAALANGIAPATADRATIDNGYNTAYAAHSLATTANTAAAAAQSTANTAQGRLNQMGGPAGEALGSEVGLGNGGYTGLATFYVQKTGYVSLSGMMTFRATGGAGIGYFRVIDSSGVVVTAGQCEVGAGQRESVGVGYNSLATYGPGQWFQLQARSSLASGMNATHVNGLSDFGATRISGFTIAQ